MTLRFLDSFDHYTNLSKKYNSATATISSGSGRRGTDALTAKNQGFTKILDAQDRLVWGFAFKTTYIGTQFYFAFFEEGASSIELRLSLNADGTFSIYDGGYNLLDTSVNSISTDTWYYIEWKADLTNLLVVLRVDGQDWITIPEYYYYQTGTMDRVLLSWGSATYSIYLDDMYILDGTGSDNDFWGDTIVAVVMPTGDGATTQWTPSTGTTHYTLLDETPPDLTDYVDTASSGSMDTYTFASPDTGISIRGIQENIWAATTSGAANVQGVVYSSGSNYFSGNLLISTTNKDVATAWSTNPATSSAWTESDITGSEFGVTLV